MVVGPNFPHRVACDFGAVHAAAVLPGRQALAANRLLAKQLWLPWSLCNNVELEALVVVRREIHVDSSLTMAFLKLHFESIRFFGAADDFCVNIAALPQEVDTGVKGKGIPISSANVRHVKTESKRLVFVDLYRDFVLKTAFLTVFGFHVCMCVCV